MIIHESEFINFWGRTVFKQNVLVVLVKKVSGLISSIQIELNDFYYVSLAETLYVSLQLGV